MKKESVRVLACGSRDWRDMAMPSLVLAGIQALYRPPYVLIHGDARGADRCAAASARELGWEVEAFPADWRGHGKAAGPIRNKLMLTDGKPDLVVAFKDDFDWTFERGGTENMVRIANDAHILTYVIGTGTRRFSPAGVVLLEVDNSDAPVAVAKPHDGPIDVLAQSGAPLCGFCREPIGSDKHLCIVDVVPASGDQEEGR